MNILKTNTVILQRRRTFNSLLLLGVLLLFAKLGFCQVGDSVRNVRHAFEGTWYCKQEKRYIRFIFEVGVNYVTVNEWISGDNTRSKDDDMDVYKVFFSGGKLVSPADNTEHRASYCEFEIVNNRMIQSCNGGMNYTDQFLKEDKYFSTSVFTRKK